MTTSGVPMQKLDHGKLPERLRHAAAGFPVEKHGIVSSANLPIGLKEPLLEAAGVIERLSSEHSVLTEEVAKANRKIAEWIVWKGDAVGLITSHEARAERAEFLLALMATCVERAYLDATASNRDAKFWADRHAVEHSSNELMRKALEFYATASVVNIPAERPGCCDDGWTARQALQGLGGGDQGAAQSHRPEARGEDAEQAPCSSCGGSEQERWMGRAGEEVGPCSVCQGVEPDLIERLLDAQQDINFAANSTMDQSLCNASALIDEIEPILRAALSASPLPSPPEQGEG